MADKIYHCRLCPNGESPDFSAAYEVATHQRKLHPVEYEAKRKASRERRQRERAASADSVNDAEIAEDGNEEMTSETDVLVNCVSWFDAAALTWAENDRVLRYLRDRFAPETSITCLADRDGARFEVLDREQSDAARLDAIESERGASGTMV